MEPRWTAWSRRRFLSRAGALTAAATFAPPLTILTHRDTGSGAARAPVSATTLEQHGRQSAAPLIDDVAAVCDRLAAGAGAICSWR